MKGVVTRVRENSVFVRLDYTNIIGIVFRENCADTPSPDVEKLYAVGDAVKARILEFDKTFIETFRSPRGGRDTGGGSDGE